MTDIETMYYQVYERNINKPLEVYRMNVHLFGAVLSPSISNFALKLSKQSNIVFM